MSELLQGNMITVISGANEESYNLEDLGRNPTVEEIASILADVMNINPNAKIRRRNPDKEIFGDMVDRNYRPVSGDEIEFIMEAGDKG